MVLNSKSEFNRCQLGRLTLGEEQKVPSNVVEEEKRKEDQEQVEQDDWEKSKSLSRRVEEVRREGVLDKGLVRSPPH